MQKNKLMFLQIGLGSMGKRRIRCLLYHGIRPDQIVGFDISKDRGLEIAKEYGIQVFDNFRKVVKEKSPDVYLVSTPPDKHAPFFIFAAKHKKHVFVEPGTGDWGYKRLFPLLDGTFVAAPSATLRYFPAIKRLKEIIERGTIGKPLSFQYHLGQYLPDWHPWEDYRHVYFAKKITGACREMFLFELIWLTDLFQTHIAKVGGFTSKVSDLDMSADDLYSSIVQFKNKMIGTVVIDLLSKTAFRTLRVIGTKGVLEWEWLDYQIRILHTKSKNPKKTDSPTGEKTWEVIDLKKGESAKHYVTTEDMYRDEIKDFLDAITGKRPYPYTFKEDHHILKTLFALEKSSKTGKIIVVKL